MVDSWIAELMKKYRRIRDNPAYTIQDLDKANEAVLFAIDKLTRIIKSRQPTRRRR